MYHGKRPRTDQSTGDADWTCSSCGNINFAFRSHCNMRKCGQPKPGPGTLGAPEVPGAPSPLGAGVSLPDSLGTPPGLEPPHQQHPFQQQLPQHPQHPQHPQQPQHPQHLLQGAPGVGAAPLPMSLAYPGHTAYIPAPMPMQHFIYDPQGQAQHLSYLGPTAVPQVSLAIGGAYGTMPGHPPVDPYMQRAAPMQGIVPYGLPPSGPPHMPPPPPQAPLPLHDGRKRRGGPDPGAPGAGGDPGDWVCPSCGNTNFSFRTHCNMRRCGEPKPPSLGAPPGTGQGHTMGPPNGSDASGGKRNQGSGGAGAAAPEGSWTCAACGNVNYPFRTHCNRRNCGVKRGPAEGDADGAPADANGEVKAE